MPPDDALVSIALSLGALVAGGAGLVVLVAALSSYAWTRRAGLVALSAAVTGAASIGAGAWMLDRAADLDERRQIESLQAHAHALVRQTHRFAEVLDALAAAPEEELRACNVPYRETRFAFDRFRPSVDALADAMIRSSGLASGGLEASLRDRLQQSRRRVEGGRAFTWTTTPGACEVTLSRRERLTVRSYLRHLANALELSAGVLGEHFEGVEFPMNDAERWPLPVHGALTEGAGVLIVLAIATLAVVAYVGTRSRSFRREEAILVLVGLLLLGGFAWLHRRATSGPEATAMTALYRQIRVTHGRAVELRRLFVSSSPPRVGRP